MQNHLMQDTQHNVCAYKNTCQHKTFNCETKIMTTNAKVLVPNQEWLIRNGSNKIGSISKVKKGYVVMHHGRSIPFNDLAEIKSVVGIASFEDNIKNTKKDNTESIVYKIYDYPCKTKPFEPLYNVQKKLPLYTKRTKSKSQLCAGYYIIKFSKGWVKSFCPKLITLERYPYHGPFKTEDELKQILSKVNKS